MAERDRRAEGGEPIEEGQEGPASRGHRGAPAGPERREEDARDHGGDRERGQRDADEIEEEPGERDASDRAGGEWCGGESGAGGTAQGADGHAGPDPTIAPSHRHCGATERADREPGTEVGDGPGIEEEHHERRGGEERIPAHDPLPETGDAHQEREGGGARGGRGPAEPGDVGDAEEGGEDPRRLPTHPGQAQDRQHPPDDESDVEAGDREEMDQPACGEAVTGVAVDCAVAVEEEGVDEGRLVAVEIGRDAEECRTSFETRDAGRGMRGCPQRTDDEYTARLVEESLGPRAPVAGGLDGAADLNRRDPRPASRVPRWPPHIHGPHAPRSDDERLHPPVRYGGRIDRDERQPHLARWQLDGAAHRLPLPGHERRELAHEERAGEEPQHGTVPRERGHNVRRKRGHNDESRNHHSRVRKTREAGRETGPEGEQQQQYRRGPHGPLRTDGFRGALKASPRSAARRRPCGTLPSR